ncbi:hypothetical protein CKM354_001276300 [Cercospora kikuchii]|uniref:ATPase AAA-type core domain-containing protein n=1 Tax=Cercospora kikuchii TaxID=84275 RepID=A0A9P3L1B3_9PEZI|nr:uncharacterized protein CKM354_001276300 [Cercospora kikuchii]GIZ49736.1 hypothetical protein CKM354_001276300 [Cercospora kikuchii]
MCSMAPFTSNSSRLSPPNSEGKEEPYHLFDDVLDLTSAKSADHDLHFLTALRSTHPDHIITTIPVTNIPLLAFASAGFATSILDLETDSFASWRGYIGPSGQARNGSLAENVHFAKYRYLWQEQEFVVWLVGAVQYVAHVRERREHPLGPSRVTDELIRAVGGWLLDGVVWVYDGYWYQDKKLFQQVQKATWDKVILDENMKTELTEVSEKFFSSRDVYDDLGVPWKRGLLFHGPPGNGKTISIKALMHTLLNRKEPIPTLYVKSAPMTYNIQQVFGQARSLAPCMLILEDIETIVTPATRSYFFNEMDGIEDNSGLFVVGSTNYLEKLDPGLTSRPSRFDRKYLFPLPNEHERTLYCQFWKKKLAHNETVEFPELLCPAMASITEGFSFAFLQECFVGSMLSLVHKADVTSDGHGDKNLDKYELWRAFKKQADVLRKEIRNESEEIAEQQQSRPFHSPLPMPALSKPPFSSLGALHRPPQGLTGLLAGGAFEQSKGQDLPNLIGKLDMQDGGDVARLNAGKRTVINPAAYELK